MGKYIVSGSGYSLTFSLASNRDLAHGYGGYGLLRPQGPYIYVSIWLEWVILIEYLGRPEDWAFYEGESIYFCLGGPELRLLHRVHNAHWSRFLLAWLWGRTTLLTAWWCLMPNFLGIATLYWLRMATAVGLSSKPNTVEFRFLWMTRICGFYFPSDRRRLTLERGRDWTYGENLRWMRIPHGGAWEYDGLWV